MLTEQDDGLRETNRAVKGERQKRRRMNPEEETKREEEEDSGDEEEIQSAFRCEINLGEEQTLAEGNKKDARFLCMDLCLKGSF